MGRSTDGSDKKETMPNAWSDWITWYLKDRLFKYLIHHPFLPQEVNRTFRNPPLKCSASLWEDPRTVLIKRLSLQETMPNAWSDWITWYLKDRLFKYLIHHPFLPQEVNRTFRNPPLKCSASLWEDPRTVLIKRLSLQETMPNAWSDWITWYLKDRLFKYLIHHPFLPQEVNRTFRNPPLKCSASLWEDPRTVLIKRRLKDVEICVPISYGTITFWLGRKASESQSHKWTVYVRGATNEDLGVVIRRAVFQLHSSFNNPIRVVDSPPFELSESGWGEFEIAITLYFHSDVCDKQLDLFHHLKLHPADESGPQSTKKPIVVESYNEIVFPDPLDSFFSRVRDHPAVIVPRLPTSFNLLAPAKERKRGDTKEHPLNQWFAKFSEADELLKLATARQQVQAHIVKLRRQLSMIDGLPHPLKLTSDE